MDDSRIAKKVLDFQPLLEWRTRQTLAGDSGGGGNPLHHRGRGVRSCVWEEIMEQVSDSRQNEDQAPRRVSWTEFALDRP